MITFIMAAGEGRRFRDSGYTIPKPLLPMPDGQPMLAWLLRALAPSKLVIAAREADRELMEPLLQEWVQSGGGKSAITRSLGTIWTAPNPQGPLAGALEACNALRGHSECLISYCDVIPRPGVGPFVMSCRHSEASAGALCFDSPEPRFGRTPSGQHAVSGLFWFRDADEFLERARGFPLGPDIGIPHVVWATKHVEVLWHIDDVIDLGTPEDYSVFMGQRTAPRGPRII